MQHQAPPSAAAPAVAAAVSMKKMHCGFYSCDSDARVSSPSLSLSTKKEHKTPNSNKCKCIYKCENANPFMYADNYRCVWGPWLQQNNTVLEIVQHICSN